MNELELSSKHSEFREQVREFLASELTPEIRQATRSLTATWLERDEMLAWQRILHKQGWLAYNWPDKFGGPGWDAIQTLLFEWECARAGAPELVAMGLRYVGPVIIHFGTEAQQKRFLPGILSGEHYWAQGFSEPGAGSDLAAIKCKAVREGGNYRLNGTKIWTTQAHMANWVFCLVRTSSETRRQDGISFLLVDMSLPGVTVEPIETIGVDREVNQVFFDNVLVPGDCLVGQEGRGWQYARFLLENERGGATFAGRLRRELGHVNDIVSARPNAARFDLKLADLDIRVRALEMLELRIFSARQNKRELTSAASVLKLAASELQQAISECGVEAAGLSGLEYSSERPVKADADLASIIMSRYLNLRAATIYGGSSEIQREIIAREIFSGAHL